MPSNDADFGRVIFSHGHKSGPDGAKIRALSRVVRKSGWTPEAIDYRDLRDEPLARVDRLVARLDQISGAVVLVGSSMGGYVSMAAAENRPVVGLWLMAPALFLENLYPGGVPPDVYRPQTGRAVLIHGWSDEVIPWRHSLRFAEAFGARLHLLDADHRLEGALPVLEELLAGFLREL